MYSFTNDYSEGAHPKVLKALIETNEIQTPGYGEDEYCKKASDKLKELLENDNVDVHYLVGGTQTNMIFIASMLKSYEAIIAVDSGHIAVHETGSIESTGHKVITRPHIEGKITVDMIQSVLDEHDNYHMVKPKAVYISQTTEYGSYYTKEEMEKIYQYCQSKNLYFFIDGARLGSALVQSDSPTLAQMAKNCDGFYIGGTKMGALFGECLVIINDQLKPDFKFYMKQRGALLAKGRLLGVQFLTLFSDNLYLEIGQYQNELAGIITHSILDEGYELFVPAKTNQVFAIFPNDIIEKLSQEFSFNISHRVDDNRSCIRLVTSFATKVDEVNRFVEVLKNLR